MRTSSLLSITIGVLMATTLAPVGVSPASATTVSQGCPSASVPATGYTDTVTSSHRSAIDCATWWGLVEGRSATSFAPTREVTRGQTAAMISRLLRESGQAPEGVGSAGFVDTEGHLFEEDIDLLAALGIVTGTTTTTYDPDAPVNRAQMASILSRTFEFGYQRPLLPGPMPFQDVAPDSVHRDAIASLVAAGVTAGTSPTTYSPGLDVPRAQMASFVTRVAGLLTAEGALQLPERRPGVDDAYASRMRATWVHLFDDTLKTSAGIDRLVAEVAAADGNTIIAQVIRRHDAYYHSEVLPRTPDPNVSVTFDVLGELLEAAHSAGIEVHAWFSVAPTTHGVYADLTAPEGWIATDHGREAPTDQRWVSRTSDGAWSDYLDPGVPEVQAHVVEVVTEIAQRYPVDGIHLDYVRYQSAQHGYNPKALDAFRAATGASGVPAADDREWLEWRREQTRRIILDARAAIADVDQDIALSAAVITWGDGPSTHDRAGFRQTMPYTRTLQDWDRWVREGALDAVMPMNYYRYHIPEQARWFDRWLAYERVLAAGSSVAVVPGPGGYLNRPDNVLIQVRAAMRADGATVYSYQQPTDDASRHVWTRLAERRWGYDPQR